MLVFQRKRRLGVLERRVRAHGRPIFGDVTDLAFKLDRPVGILVVLTLERDCTDDRADEQRCQKEAEPPSRDMHL